jgi:murein DD-endopeptidase MepM/ murein hydrolase activator NlpD
MTDRRPQSRVSAAAPWIVATIILAAAWTASYGPLRRSVAVPEVTSATSAARVAPAPAAASGEQPRAYGPAVPQAAVPGPTLSVGSDADVVELRRRRLPIPVEGVSAALLVPTFHQPRSQGEHAALDILAPRGTPVVAVEDAQVAKLFTSQRGGLTIYLFDSTSIYCYYYAHLDQYAEGLRDGQHVVRGEVIGYVGTTGNAPRNTPHLHFAVFKLGPEKNWWQGTAIDPYLIWR